MKNSYKKYDVEHDLSNLESAREFIFDQLKMLFSSKEELIFYLDGKLSELDEQITR